VFGGVLTELGGGVDWVTPMNISTGVVQNFTEMHSEASDIDLIA